jgi:hypothetical protein
MARITESQLRSIIKQELKATLLETGLFADKDDRYGLSIEFGDYGCEEMQDAIVRTKNTPEGEYYHGKNDGYSKEEVVAFLNDRIARRCGG